MTATILLCILSTLSFCLTLRGLVAVVTSAKNTRNAGSPARAGFSNSAWRMARAYVAFALLTLAALSLFGVFRNYFDLFNH